MNFEQTLTALENGHKLAETEKSIIQAEAEKRGIYLNKKCGSCYHDALIQFIAQDRNPDKMKTQKKLSHWKCQKGLDVVFRGERVNESTLTDEIALRLHRAGFPSRLLWFKKPTQEEIQARKERFKQHLEERFKDETPEQKQARLQKLEDFKKRAQEHREARLAELKNDA